jgi:hypothetical protein
VIIVLNSLFKDEIQFLVSRCFLYIYNIATNIQFYSLLVISININQKTLLNMLKVNFKLPGKLTFLSLLLFTMSCEVENTKIVNRLV